MPPRVAKAASNANLKAAMAAKAAKDAEEGARAEEVSGGGVDAGAGDSQEGEASGSGASTIGDPSSMAAAFETPHGTSRLPHR